MYVFNTITGINESKSLTKNRSCECKSKFDGRQCKKPCNCKTTLYM